MGETGTCYALILTRSVDFSEYHSVLKLQVWNQRDLRIGLSLMQQVWDPAESAGWLRVMNKDPYLDSPAKQVLLQAAFGDAQVTPISAHVQARAYGSVGVAPTLRDIDGVRVERAPLPSGTSVIVEWKYGGVPTAPLTNTPPLKRTDTHECVPRTPKAQEQLHDFFETGIINNYCDGAGGYCTMDRCPWSGWGKDD